VYRKNESAKTFDQKGLKKYALKAHAAGKEKICQDLV